MRTVAIGCGHWHTRRYLEGFQKGGARIVGVEDPDAAVAREVAASVGCEAYGSIDELLDRAQPELALLLGEPAHMARGARAVVASRIPFVAEKPIALTSGEVFEIAAAAEQAGVFAAVAFVNRMRALWSVYDELRSGGRLGRLSHLAARTINGPPRRYADWHSAWMLDPTRSGGGALHNLGIHAIDAFLHLTGADPEDVRIGGVTLSSRAHREPIEDYGLALLRAPDDTVGVIEAGYVYPVVAAGMTRGGDPPGGVAASGVYLEENAAELRTTWPDGREESRPSGASYESFCLDTLARLRDGRPPLATPRDCARAVRLLERIYAAVR